MVAATEPLIRALTDMNPPRESLIRRWPAAFLGLSRVLSIMASRAKKGVFTVVGVGKTYLDLRKGKWGEGELYISSGGGGIYKLIGGESIHMI